MKSTATDRIASFLTFFGLAPILLSYAVLLFGVLLSLSILLNDPAGLPGAGGLMGLGLGLILLPLVVTLGLYMALRREPRWIRRGIYLYIGLDLLLTALVFLVLLGLGGASMAAVEGAVGGRLLAEGAITEAVVWLIVAQGLVIPWAAGVTYVSRRRAQSS